jgi:hypothetical protein
MTLDILLLVQSEHRERIRDFNVRAARGEFIRYPDNSPKIGLRQRLGQLARLIRFRVSRERVDALVADSA